jgi:predicted ribosome quality control (RQC) complex YloA/Tae2 family protein
MSRPSPFPLLSFRELERYIASERGLEGFRVERVFAPEAPSHPDRYFKKEWVLELNSPNAGAQIYFSVRSQQCGVVILPRKTLKPSKVATKSVFDLSLSKKVEGLRIDRLSTLPNERLVRIQFSNSLELVLILLPSQPEAILLESGLPIASTKTRGESDAAFQMPAPRTLTPEQIQKIPLRTEWSDSPETYAKSWLDAREDSALALRRQRLEQLLKTQIDSLKRKRHSLQEQLTQSQNEPNWEAYGTLLQTHFYAKPVPKNGHYELMDYEKDQLVQIPADPKLNLKQQLERYFHLAKRNRTRLTETESRMNAITEKVTEAQASLDLVQTLTSPEAFESVETKLGVGVTQGQGSSKDQKKLAEFTGKQYTSKEGLTILVGRNLTENLELTFKIARGNDLWLHVKGRPGSHAVILLPPKRTASLDTLLDAAQLCILHSGGKDWGKTEVDYTFRKHVKKVKNQTEVIYTHNKTLSVEMDETRLKRLYENT